MSKKHKSSSTHPSPTQPADPVESRPESRGVIDGVTPTGMSAMTGGAESREEKRMENKRDNEIFGLHVECSDPLQMELIDLLQSELIYGQNLTTSRLQAAV